MERTDNPAYAENVARTMARLGVRFTDGTCYRAKPLEMVP
jgi:hypothetical protein